MTTMPLPDQREWQREFASFLESYVEPRSVVVLAGAGGEGKSTLRFDRRNKPGEVWLEADGWKPCLHHLRQIAILLHVKVILIVTCSPHTNWEMIQDIALDVGTKKAASDEASNNKGSDACDDPQFWFGAGQIKATVFT